MLCVLLLLAIVPALGLAQDAAAPSPEAVVQAAEKSVNRVGTELEDAGTPETLSALTTQADKAKAELDDAAKALQPQLDQLNEQLAQLGVLAEGSTEAPELAAQRRKLTRQRDDVDATIKRARTAAVRATQLAADIEKLRVSQMSAELGRKLASPLSPALWRQVAAALPADAARVLPLYNHGKATLRAALKEHGWTVPLLGAGAALLLFFPLRLWLRALGRRYAASERAPQGRLRRSGLAVWLLVVGTVLPALAAWTLVESLDAIGGIAARLQTLSRDFIVATTFAALVAALSACLLAPNRPSWRLLDLDDLAARKLRKYAWTTAGLIWLAAMLQSVDHATRTSEITTIALDGVIALTYLGLIMAMLVTLARLHRRQTAEAAERAEAQAADNRAKGPAERSGWLVLARVAGNAVVVTAILATLLGYLNFAQFVTQQLIWGGVVVLATVLLLKFADDFCTWILHPSSRLGRTVVLTTGLSGAQVEQAGVLLSAFTRIVVVVLALILFTAPFGNMGAVVGSLEALAEGYTIGSVTLKPSKVLLAVVVLLIGLAVMQAVQRWLSDTYLPKTELDVGARNSISTVARYVGIILAVLWALTALGIGFGQLALVVSALSVGIGFGLQAITQNFVSGLILLAERPVKIGDWIKLGDQEGDIRRINVRSTEITVGDKSTLIVPNSELITKTVRNMTMGNAQGRIQIQFLVPLNTDVAMVKQVLLDAYAEHPAVLEDPAPSVFIDSIANGQVSLNSFAYVPSPRQTYGVRSDLYFTLLKVLHDMDIALAAPTDIHLVREPR